MQPNCDFPAAHSMDTEWFAIDSKGQVAIFSTGEDGDLPVAAKDGDSLLDDLVPEYEGVALQSRGIVVDATGMKEPYMPTLIMSAGSGAPVLLDGGHKGDLAFRKRFGDHDAFYGSYRWSYYHPYKSAQQGIYGYHFDYNINAYVRVERLYEPLVVDQLPPAVADALRNVAAPASGDFSRQPLLSCSQEWPGATRRYYDEFRYAPSVTGFLETLAQARAAAHKGLTKRRPALKPLPTVFGAEAAIPYVKHTFSPTTVEALAQGRLALCGDRGVCARTSWRKLEDSFVFLAPGNCFLVVPEIGYMFGLVILPCALEAFAIPLELDRSTSLEDNAARWMCVPLRQFSNPMGIPRQILDLKGAAQPTAVAEFLRVVRAA